MIVRLFAGLFVVLGMTNLARAQCPSPPASVTVQGGSPQCASTATVLWSAVSGVTGFDVARNTTSNSATATVIGSVSGTTGSFLDPSPPVNQNVFYFVRSKSNPGIGCISGIGNWSAPALVALYTPLTGSPTPPSVVSSACSGVTLSWSAVNGAQTYQVWSGPTPSFGAASLLTTVATTSAVLPPADVTARYVFIRAVNPCGLGVPGPSTLVPTFTGATITGVSFAVPACDRVQANLVGFAPATLVVLTWMNPPGGSPAPIGAVFPSGSTVTSNPLTGATPGQSVTVKVELLDTTCSTVVQSVTASGVLGGALSASVPGTIAITGQPISIVGATNPPSPAFVTYSWLKDGLPVSSDGGRITGLTTPTLSFSSAKVQDVGSYTLVVNNTCSAGSSVSGSGVLAVRVPCRADFDQSGTLALTDIFDFLNAWFAGCP